MTRYSIRAKNQIFVKGYVLLSFAKNINKNIGKTGKNLSGKYSQKRPNHAKQSVTDDALKTASKRAIQKTAEVTGDFISNKIADKITKSLKNFTTE